MDRGAKNKHEEEDMKMRKRTKILMAWLVLLLLPIPASLKIPPAPRETAADYGFGALDQATMKSLLAQGTLIIVRQKSDLSLINITAGQVVNAPLEVCWATINDYANYPKFMPQTTEMKQIEKESDLKAVYQQTIAVKIWRLPAVETTYQLAHEATPSKKIRFWWVAGDLQGTYGGWDLVPVGQQTMVFYTLFSNLTSMGWGLGAVFKSEPDFMAGINVTTAIMTSKAVKTEAEKRAKKR